MGRFRGIKQTKAGPHINSDSLNAELILRPLHTDAVSTVPLVHDDPPY